MYYQALTIHKKSREAVDIFTSLWYFHLFTKIHKLFSSFAFEITTFLF